VWSERLVAVVYVALPMAVLTQEIGAEKRQSVEKLHFEKGSEFLM